MNIERLSWHYSHIFKSPVRFEAMTHTAYLFPGQGSQKPRMNEALIQSNPETRSVFDTAEKILGFNPFESEKINLTAYAQPAILIYSVAMLSCRHCERSKAIQEKAGLPRRSAPHNDDAIYSLAADQQVYLAGHSLGEYSALVAGGVLSFEEALKAVHYRGQVMQEAVPVGEGAMLAVLSANPDYLTKICEENSDYVAVANYNGPGQTVLSGTQSGIEQIKERLKQEGIKKLIDLPVSAPFHCKLMQPAQDKLAAYLDKLVFEDSSYPILNNVTAEPIKSGKQIKNLLIEQVTRPVQFTKIAWFLSQQGVTDFVEIGPGKTLTNLIKRMGFETGESNAV